MTNYHIGHIRLVYLNSCERYDITKYDALTCKLYACYVITHQSIVVRYVFARASRALVFLRDLVYLNIFTNSTV